MLRWGDKMREIMDQVKMTSYMEGSYVDDIRYVVWRLSPGVKWCQKKNKFLYKEEWAKDHIETGGGKWYENCKWALQGNEFCLYCHLENRILEQSIQLIEMKQSTDKHNTNEHF